MPIYLFATFISFIVNVILIVPFINFLYKTKMQRAEQKTKDAFNKLTPIFDKFNKHKAGTPVGGGLLVITSTVLLYLLFLSMFSIFRSLFSRTSHLCSLSLRYFSLPFSALVCWACTMILRKYFSGRSSISLA